MKTLEKTRSLEKEILVDEAKRIFEFELREKLNLVKVNAPLFVSKNSGFNDDLNGVENAVGFLLDGVEHQIVHSLAKWKRWYLGELDAPVGKGIVTDLKAIRADEELTDIHSHLVDQWDWEKVISREDRTIATLVEHGIAVYETLRIVDEIVSTKLELTTQLPHEIEVIHSEDLYQKYPKLSPKEREHAITEEFGAVLLLGIGGKLSNGEVHDLRAPDYDDWSTKDDKGRPGINADLLVWDRRRGLSVEISSMGVRVDEAALELQLREKGSLDRLELPFHRKLINGELPCTIGGGIGQSRVAMFVTRERNIANVQPVFSL